jgi:hypothetical protein
MAYVAPSVCTIRKKFDPTYKKTYLTIIFIYLYVESLIGVEAIQDRNMSL